MANEMKRRIAALEASIIRGEVIPFDPDTSPTLAEFHAVSSFAQEAFAQSNASRADCYAKIHGLRNAKSLIPWLQEGVNDVEELARRDYQPEFGDAWQEEWERQKDEALIILEGRCGREWPAALADRVASSRQDAMATKRQGAM